MILSLEDHGSDLWQYRYAVKCFVADHSDSLSTLWALRGGNLVMTKRVFIFAHCDDELFCLPLLLDKNSESTLIFLTTIDRSDISNSVDDVRQREALRANIYLNKFGTFRTLFYNKDIFDGTIHSDFDLASFKELTRIVLAENPDELITLCFEAGHQDHDSVNLITRILSKNNKITIRCFSGYRASPKSPKLFLVLKPMVPIGKISFNRFLSIVISIRLMLIYRSQAKTWLGLAPTLLLKYAFSPCREGSSASSTYPEHISNCFYENRGRALQSGVLLAHQKFLADFAL